MIDAILIGAAVTLVLAAMVGWQQADRIGLAPAALLTPAFILVLTLPLATWSMMVPDGTDMGQASGYLLFVFALIVAGAALVIGLGAGLLKLRKLRRQ